MRKFLLLILGILAVGCGGGGGGSTSVTQAAQGHISFKIKWPTRSRLVPYNTNTITVSIAGPTPLGPIPLTSSVTNYTTAPLLAGTYTVSATAFNGTGGSLGNALAQGSVGSIVITGGQTTPIVLTMATDLTEILVTLNQPGNSPVTVQSTSPFTQSGAISLVPTLPAQFTVVPSDVLNTLVLFPSPPSNPLQVGTNASDTVQVLGGLVPQLVNSLASNSLVFNVSATSTGLSGFNVNYWEPSSPNAPISAMPVAVNVSNVTLSSAPTLAVPAGSTGITTIEDVALDTSNAGSLPEYIVFDGTSFYLVNTAQITGVSLMPTALAAPPTNPTLLASFGSGAGVYASRTAAQTRLTLWDQLNHTNLANSVADVSSTPGDTNEAYALDSGNIVYTVSNAPSASSLITLGGTPVFAAVGSDLNSSNTTNRVVYWISSTGTLHQTFTSPLPGEPAFGPTLPTGLAAVAEVAGCPLTFVISGTTLEGISQTGTVVGSGISLPSSNTFDATPGNRAITYTHLSVNVKASGAVTGVAVGHDLGGEPIYVTF